MGGSGALQADLVDRARSGDREAFAVLAGGAVDRLYAIARLVLRDADLAQDATQDALVRAWRDLPTLRDVERFDAWLHRLVVRSCADIGRHRRRWRTEITILPNEPAEPDRAGAARRSRPAGAWASSPDDRAADGPRPALLPRPGSDRSWPRHSTSPSGPPSPGCTTRSRRSGRHWPPMSAPSVDLVREGRSA